MAHKVDIVVLHTDGCAATPPTVELISRVMEDMSVDSELTLVLMESQERAHELRFLGSPTVQIGGVDIDPAARGVHHFGLG